MKPLLLTSHIRRNNDYDNIWYERELQAYSNAGFEVETIDIGFLPPANKIHDDDHFRNRQVFQRCYSGQEYELERIIRRAAGHPIVPNIDTANDWYKSLTWQRSWFGREIGHSDMRQFGYLDDPWQRNALEKHVKMIFDFFAVGEDVFFKSADKGQFQAELRNKSQALADLNYILSMSVHDRLHTLIFSQPMDIEFNNDAFGREEYRVFIVDDKVSTISLFTDKTMSRDYTRVNAYAESFAKQFCNFLPLGYCLDVAITDANELMVVELNGIGASGFFADHDIDKLFMDIAALAGRYASRY